jgi:hypothetical protein
LALKRGNILRFYKVLLRISETNNQEFLDQLKAKTVSLRSTFHKELVTSYTMPIDIDVKQITQLIKDISKDRVSIYSEMVPIIQVNSIQSICIFNFNNFHDLHENDLDTIKMLINDYEISLFEKLNQLYIDHKTKNINDFVNTIIHYKELIEADLLSFTKTTSNLKLIYTDKLNSSQRSEAELVGQLMVHHGYLIRLSIAVFASSSCIQLLPYKSLYFKKCQDFLKKSSEMPFTKVIKNGLNVDINKIGREHDNKFIQIKGYVKSFEIGKGNRNNLISKMDVEDLSSGASVTVVAQYVHFKKIGIHTNSYVDLSGIYKLSSNINFGKPALEIDVLTTNEIVSESWLNTFVNISKIFIELYPSKLNMRYSLINNTELSSQETIDSNEALHRKLVTHKLITYKKK